MAMGSRMKRWTGFCSIFAAACSMTPAAHGETEGDQLFRAGRFKDAKAAYEAEGTESAARYVRLGEIALLSNRFEEAETAFSKALDLQPGHKRAHEGVGEAYYRQNRFAEAAPQFAASGQKARARKVEALQSAPNRILGDEACASVPFERTDPLPVVKASVNGAPDAYFILDTGGGEVILDTDLAESLKIQTFGTEEGTFAGGKKAKSRHGAIERFSLGGMSVENVPVTVMNTKPFSAAAGGLPVSGVIGTVFFYQFRATIDYPGERLVLAKKGGICDDAPSGAVAASMPIWLADDHLILARGHLNNAPEALLLVDTGLAGYAFTAPGAVMEAAGIDIGGQSFEGVGGGGKVKVTPVMAESLTLGGFERQSLPGLYGAFPESLSDGLGIEVHGLVSHGFFRPYAVTFDFKAMTMTLREAGEP